MIGDCNFSKTSTSSDASADMYQGARPETLASHPNLARVVDAWATLPDSIGQAILAIVETTIPPTPTAQRRREGKTCNRKVQTEWETRTVLVGPIGDHVCKNGEKSS